MESSQSTRSRLKNELEPLGSRLRERRRALGLTLQEVADATNLSIGFISQLERDLTSPSLASLAAIAQTLQSHVSEFLVVPGAGSSVTRPSNRNHHAVTADGRIYERISAAFPGHMLNSVILHAPPGYRSEIGRHEGEELYYMLDGSATFELEDEHIVLHAGDSMHFESGRSHSSWNHTTETARILVVCTMDVFGDRKNTPLDGNRSVSRKKIPKEPVKQKKKKGDL